MNRVSTNNLTKKNVPQKKRIQRGLLLAMRKMRLKNSHVCVSFVSDLQIKKLNKTYRSIDKATDVLSFGQNATIGTMRLLGDIVISTQTSAKQAQLAKKTHFQELLLLSVHGLLHLLGYDHATKKEETRMFGLQDDLIEHIISKKI